MWRLVSVLAAVGLSGCSVAEEVFFNREVQLKPGYGQMSDIKQRGVFVQNRPDGDGVMSPVACAEPSPDAMSAVAASLAAKVSVDGGQGSGGLAASMAESAAFTGLRTQTIQLLRDGFYRMCEGYMGGALNAEDFTIMQRRYQANMLALLTIEQLTGAVKVPAVTLAGSGAASLESNVAALIKERDTATLKRDKDKATLDAAKAAQPPKSADEIKSLEKVLEEDESKIKELTKLIAAGGDLVTYASQTGTIGTNGYAGPTAETMKEVSSAVVNVAKSVLEADYSGQLCFEHFRRKDKASAKRSLAWKETPGDESEVDGVTDYCNRWFTRTIGKMKVTTELVNECLKLAGAMREAKKLDEAAKLFATCPTYADGGLGPMNVIKGVPERNLPIKPSGI